MRFYPHNPCQDTFSKQMATVESLTDVDGYEELKHLKHVVEVCGNISGNNDRCTAFREHAAPIKSLIAMIYDPFQKFHVTSKNVLKFEKSRMIHVSNTPCCSSLSDLLHRLTDRKVTGHDALNLCVQFTLSHSKFRDVILRALDKDLGIRVGIKMVNKAFPFLVPVFSCALSHPIEKHFKFFEAHRNQWWYSRKLDGCRCIFVCENGKVTAYSRSGHVYPSHIEGLSYFLDRLKHVEGVIDGEMGVVDESNKEHFNIANSLMNPNATVKRNKKNLKMQPGQYMCYFAFDFIPLDTFKHGKGGPKWSERQKLLKKNVQFDKQLRFLDQYPSKESDALWEKAQDQGWEGLMLRLDDDYEGKKSRKMLKRKRQDDEEFEIEEATTSMQMPPSSTTAVKALEHVGISYRGCRVWVGGGFSWEQKEEFGKNPEALVGATITVKHYGESRDREGNYSLRHPSVKTFWGQKGRQH